MYVFQRSKAINFGHFSFSDIHVAAFIFYHNPYVLKIHVNLADLCHVHIHTYIHGGQFYEQILEHIRHGHCLYVVGRPTQRTDAPATPFTLLQHGRTLHGHGHEVPALGAHWSLQLIACNNTLQSYWR